jgi:pyruvate formate lyase activating enzyme
MDDHIDDLAELVHELPDSVNIRLNAFSVHGVAGEAKTWEPCSQNELNAFADRLHQKGITRLTKTEVFY